MFGLSEQELDRYRDLAQEFAVKDLTPVITGEAKLLTVLIEQNGKLIPNMSYVNKMISDLESIITLTASHMAHDYAHLECDPNMTEEEIIKHLHDKYESYVTIQFIKYCLCPSASAAERIVGEIILELPYLYVASIENESFDEDLYLEEKLKAYNDYLEKSSIFEEEDEEE